MEEAELGHDQRFHDPQRSYHCKVCFTDVNGKVVGMLTFEQHITKLRITNAQIIVRSNVSLMLSDVPVLMRYKLVADEYNFGTEWISGSRMIADIF